jgi:hypothetical protein
VLYLKHSIPCSRIRYECFEDVGDVCNAEKASEKSEENRKVSSDNGVSVDDPVAVQDPEYPVDGLEDDIHHVTLNETGAQEKKRIGPALFKEMSPGCLTQPPCRDVQGLPNKLDTTLLSLGISMFSSRLSTSFSGFLL